MRYKTGDSPPLSDPEKAELDAAWPTMLPAIRAAIQSFGAILFFLVCSSFISGSTVLF